MKRLLLAACATAAAVAVGDASAATLCAGGSHCFTTIQSAVDAAHEGDTITIAPGTFAGGVTIDVSIDLRGAGAGATIIKGGGPVLTIGTEEGDTEPVVSVSGVTITGGHNDSHPDHAVTQGGGVRIPQGSFETRSGLGATVTISDSVISGNSVASQQLLPSGFCGPFDCSFAAGGGIWSAGTLTVKNTRVTNNQAGDPRSLTVVADGGGITSGSQGSLTVVHSVVSGNRIVGAPSWLDTVNAAGINSFGPVVIDGSIVSDNRAELVTDDSTEEFPAALGGGIGLGAAATISHSVISGNRVTSLNTNGQALAVGGGIFDEGNLTLTDSTISGNAVSSTATADTALAAAGGLEVNATATLRDNRIVGNSITARAPAGRVEVGGGGIANFGTTTVERTLVAANRIDAAGRDGFAHGGGIESASLFGSAPSLTLVDSVVAANVVTGSPALTLEGGGLFAEFPVTLTRTLIAGNKPDQCFGC